MDKMLWDDFINSYWRDWRTGDRSKDRDMLDDAEWLAKWLEERGFIAPVPMPSAELSSAKRLRSFLWESVQRLVHGEVPDRDMVVGLNVYMADWPVVRKAALNTEGYCEVKLTPKEAGWEPILAEIANSFAQALADKDQSRFRICDNPDCLWVYYDDTRNHSKRFCDDKLCGNLMKVRRFRARKKAEAEAGTEQI
jgi:predicted RNA-binding Zn ribbon-like protein